MSVDRSLWIKASDLSASSSSLFVVVVCLCGDLHEKHKNDISVVIKTCCTKDVAKIPSAIEFIVGRSRYPWSMRMFSSFFFFEAMNYKLPKQSQ